jgi:hypothetical protein
VELTGFALRAEVRDVDSGRVEARVEELIAVGGSEVEVCPSLLSEMRGDLGADFVAALPDPGADSGMEIGRRRIEAGAHAVHRAADDLRDGPSPSGMDGGNGPTALVGQKYGDTIGGLDGNDGPGGVFEEGVAFADDARPALSGDARRGVNLLDRRKVCEETGDVGVPRSETVDEPRESVEFSDAVDVARVFVEH